MSVTRIRYDERQFSSADQCLAEIKSRLERGWSLSELARTGGRVRAVFSWHESPDGAPFPPAEPGGLQ